MVPFSTSLAVYLVVILTAAAVASVVALGTLTQIVVRSRHARIRSHQSLRAYYGPRLALHH